MSPSSRDINGPRPAPLKIHKDSHHIHKQSSSSSSSSSTTTTTTTSSSSSGTHHHPPRHHPVIIYTHSPKIIHTQARDFMALVQKLTGLSHSADDNDDSSATATNNHPPPPSNNIPRKEADTAHAANDDSSSSSEICSAAGDVVHHSLPSAAAMAMPPLGFDPPPPPNPFLSEIPLFTPNDGAILLDPKANKVIREYPPLKGGARNYPASGMSVLLPLDLRRSVVTAEVLICGSCPRDSFKLLIKSKAENISP